MLKNLILLITILSVLLNSDLVKAQDIRYVDSEQEVQVPVYTTVNATFTVKLPSSIELSKDPSSGKGIFSSIVGVKGDIEKGKCVEVIPDTSFNLFDVTKRPLGNVKIPESEAEQSGYTHKSPEIVNVNQMETVWKEEEFSTLIKGAGSNFVYDAGSGYHNVNLNVSTLNAVTAGKWEGTLPFEILYGTYYPITETYPDVTAMLASEASPGSFIRTRGHYATKDGGSAVYEVMDTAVANDMTIFRLNNGKFAKLKTDNSSLVKLESVGITPNNFTSDKFNQLLDLLDGECKGVQFSNGKYYVDKKISLKSMSYCGMGNTALIVDSRYSTNEFNIITTLATEGPYNIEMCGLDFTYYTSNDHLLNSTESCLVSLHNIDSCKIDNCNFLSMPSEENGSYMRTDLLWFHQTDNIQNVSITNSTLKSLSPTALSPGTTSDSGGGSLWISGPTGTCPRINNILIKDCEFETAASDEAVAFWNGDFNNVLISDCVIKNTEGYTTDNLITFYNGSFNNVAVENCNVNVSTIDEYVYKVTGLTSKSEVKFKNCNTTLNCGVIDLSSYGVFLLGKDKIEHAGISTLILDDCSVTGAVESKFGSLVTSTNAKNKKVIFKHCNVDAFLSKGLVYAQTSDCMQYSVEDSTVNTHSDLAYMNGSTNVSMRVKGNTIYSNLKVTVAQKAQFDYEFVENICDADVDTLVYASWIDQVNAFVNILERNNNISDDDYHIFKSSNVIDESSIVSITH